MQDNLKLIEEYHSIDNFKDKYEFYQNHYKELRFIEPSNPLIIEYEESSKVLQENDKRVSVNGIGYMDEQYRKAELRKLNARDAIIQYYKENDLEEPKPSNDVEGGQVVEFWVKRYKQESTFEEKKIGFLESIKDGYANEIIPEELEIVEIQLNKISGINNLKITLSKTYKIDFTKIYKFVRSDNKKLEVKDYVKAYTHPILIDYESLAKAIPWIQYKTFLKDNLQPPLPVQSVEVRKVTKTVNNLNQEDVKIRDYFKVAKKDNKQSDALHATLKAMGISKDNMELYKAEQKRIRQRLVRIGEWEEKATKIHIKATE